jgi:hypothetical protein
VGEQSERTETGANALVEQPQGDIDEREWVFRLVWIQAAAFKGQFETSSRWDATKGSGACLR